jgi:hypothetical protein
MRLTVIFVCAFLLVANLSCSVNVLENFADKTTNDALLIDAKILINKGFYSEALAKMNLMSNSFQAGRGVVALKAQAHAGLCGLIFFDFVLALKDLGTQRIFPFLLGAFRSGSDTTKIDACVTAENLIKSLGAVSARSTDENLLMLLVSFTKVAQVLSYYADADQDGTATAAYDICAAGGARTAAASMPDADVGEVGTGLTLAMASLAAVAGSVDLGSGTLDSITTACASVPPQFNFCSKIEKTDFTADELTAIRSFVREGSAYGLDLNGCAGGSVSGSASCRCF